MCVLLAEKKIHRLPICRFGKCAQWMTAPKQCLTWQQLLVLSRMKNLGNSGNSQNSTSQRFKQRLLEFLTFHTHIEKEKIWIPTNKPQQCTYSQKPVAQFPRTIWKPYLSWENYRIALTLSMDLASKCFLLHPASHSPQLNCPGASMVNRVTLVPFSLVQKKNKRIQKDTKGMTWSFRQDPTPQPPHDGARPMFRSLRHWTVMRKRCLIKAVCFNSKRSTTTTACRQTPGGDP